MDKTLVILAAGIGSRYGVGIKQLEGFGPQNELMECSVFQNFPNNQVMFRIDRE